MHRKSRLKKNKRSYQYFLTLRIVRFLALASVCWLTHSSAAANKLFADDTILEIQLTGPLGSLIRDSEDWQEQPFSLLVNNTEQKIKVRPRGKSRLRVCKFPPLRLNFSSKSSLNTLFADQDKLKLVTKCDRSKRNDNETLFEYAAYRIFNLISDTSYKVRLAKVSFVDTDEILKPELQQQYGFLIESDKHLAERLNLNRKKVKGVSLKYMDADQMASIYIFQYLIGNTDWSLVAPEAGRKVAPDLDKKRAPDSGKKASKESQMKCCHNGDIFESNAIYYYVPYDFDLSGLVKPKYALPDASLGIRRVTQRKYRGFCHSPAAMAAALSKINNLKPQIIEILRSLPNLSEKELSPKVKFLEKFFSASENQQKLLKNFQKRCLK